MATRSARTAFNLCINRSRSHLNSKSLYHSSLRSWRCSGPSSSSLCRYFSVGATTTPPSQSAIDPIANTGLKANHNENPSSPVNPVDAQSANPPNDPKTDTPESSSTQSSDNSAKQSSNTGPVPLEQMRIRPQLIAAFTCTHCETRSTRRISRQAYSEGVVLARCGGCQKLHLLADHLGWFGDRRETIEDIMREKGVEVQRVSLPQDNSGVEHPSADAISPQATDDSVHFLPEAHLRWREHDNVLEVTPDEVAVQSQDKQT